MKKLTWRELNHTLVSKTEDEVLQMLNEERVGTRRIVVLERLHQRYNILRVSRERVDLLNGAPIQAHSKTEYKRMVAQGANVLPPRR